MAPQIKTKGKAKLIDGEQRYTLYLYGDMKLKFRRDDDAWYVTVKREDFKPIEMMVHLPPTVEYARLIAECVPNWRLIRAEEAVHILSRVEKLNKKKPRASFERLFELKRGWPVTRRKRLIKRYRSEGYILKKSGNYTLTSEGLIELNAQREVIGQFRRLRDDELGKKTIKKKGD